ncbi:hypothetical protein NLU13_4396 [Sarocladium strictum]|uniref:MINDY deubiquitinase domain-containing protein n=1 Tax=Sarocladium strictum TaxID=5046 RepID=A0AA39GJF5_SARSR|nr:hypothetical protein NLU13_4396 [Sarocladium strictum]
MIPRKPVGDSSSSPDGLRPSSQVADNPWHDGQVTDNAWEDFGIRNRNNNSPSDSRSPHVPNVPRPGDVPHVTKSGEALNAWDPSQLNERRPPKIETTSGFPEVLRPGAGGNRAETNPFLKQRHSPTEPGPPSDAFSKLDLEESATNPWRPNDDGTPALISSDPPPPIVLQTENSDPWAQPKGPSPQPASSPAVVSLPSEDGSGWDDEPPLIKVRAPDAPPKTEMSRELAEDEHVWDDLDDPTSAKGKNKATDGDDWNLIDTDSASSSPTKKTNQVEEPPLTPKPDKPTERKKWVPPRQPVDGKSETYQIKNIEWQDLSMGREMRTSPILVQNANGPCPLVALVNALTLTTPSNIPDTALVQILRSREQVSLNLLLDAVFDELMSSRRTTYDDALPDVSELYSFLQSLHTGMNVNPRFVPSASMVEAYQNTSLTHLDAAERTELIPGTFENTAEMGLYATFSIPLIHGWLPPRSEPVYEAFERQAASYEDAQNLFFREEELESKLMSPSGALSNEEQQLYQDILTIKSFLDTSATQLTPWGIEVIRKSMRPGTFAIFFRNDHFSTLYCHPESRELFSLVTDAGYRTHTKVVWESLVDVNGERTQFLTGDYRPIRSGDLVSNSTGTRVESQGDHWETLHNFHGKATGPNERSVAGKIFDHEQEDRDLALALQLQEEEEERQREDEARRQRERQLSEQYIEQQGRQPGVASGGGRGGPLGRGGRGGRGGGAIGRGGTTASAGSSTGLVPERRSSNSVNAPVTSTTPPRSPAPAQVVRPLIPPRRTGTLPQAGEEAAPTYEQAQSDPTYEPPIGHPAHATSSRDSRRTSGASTGPATTSTSALPARGGGQVPVRGGRLPQRPPGPYGRDRDRDCVIM